MLCLLINNRFKLVSDNISDNDEFRQKGKKNRTSSTSYPCIRPCNNNNFSINEMPQYLRFNPWIRKGYRSANLSTLECFKSCITIHNETINILTHFLPLLYIFYNYKSMFNCNLFKSYLTYCHLISCLSSWIGSLIYHIFMNHRCGHYIYDRLLKADMIGIWITQTFGALTTINASLKEFPDNLRIQSVIFYLILSFYALHKGLTARQAWQRPFSFALLVLVRAICLIVRIKTHHHHQHNCNHHQLSLMNDANNNSGFNNKDNIDDVDKIYIHVIGQELWPIIGAIISVLRIPERFFPGKFDLFLNSHNIMHCLVVLGGFHMHQAFLNDIQYFL